MLYTAPPPLPVPIYNKDDCKRGDRDCFPENTQGGVIQAAPLTNFRQSLLTVSPLMAQQSNP